MTFNRNKKSKKTADEKWADLRALATPGRLFRVPLLGGGFAFGYVTFSENIGTFVNVFDHLSEADNLPEGFESMSLLVENMLVGLDDFFPRSKKERQQMGDAWSLLDAKMPFEVKPSVRYVVMSKDLLPRRIDLYGAEKDVGITTDEARDMIGLSFPGYPEQASLIEVKLKGLSLTPLELYRAWKSGDLAAGRTAARDESEDLVPSSVSIQLQIDSAFPGDAALSARRELEREVEVRGLGKVIGSGGGMRVMDVQVRIADSSTDADFRRLLADLDLQNKATLFYS